jgi:hypothetical protein
MELLFTLIDSFNLLGRGDGELIEKYLAVADLQTIVIISVRKAIKMRGSAWV